MRRINPNTRRNQSPEQLKLQVHARKLAAEQAAQLVITMREGSGMSRTQLAQKLGISTGRLIDIESARVRTTTCVHDAVPLSIVFEVADATGFEISFELVPTQI